MDWPESPVAASETATELLARALELPETDRVEIAYQLLISLEPREPEDPELTWEASWAAEIERRMRSFEADPSRAIPWRDAIKQIRESLRRGRP